MSSIAISGDTSGAVTIAAPAVAGTNTMTLVAGTGTLAPKVLSTAVTATSGTSIDFTNIPSWVTRITVMLNGVSTNGTSIIQAQIGSGSFTTSGYVSAGQNSTNNNSSTTGFVIIPVVTAANAHNGVFTLVNLTGTAWMWGGNYSYTAQAGSCSGSVSLSGVLDRVRITTVNGTDTFDAGTINIMYE